MWQIILGIFLIVILFCGIFFWSALVLAKETDQKIASSDLQ